MLPPPEKMIRELLTPNQTDGYYTQLVARTSSVFQANSPIKRGTLYQDIVGADQRVIDLFPAGLWFTKEVKAPALGNTDQWVLWIWSTDTLAESQANAEIGYMEEAVAYPTYDRVSSVRRELYEAAPYATAASSLTALIGVTITGGGTGYTHATGAIENATVEFVCSAGVLISAVVTNEGNSITSGGDITITGDGTGATATAVIQPASCVLIGQKKVEYSSDHPLCNEFVQVMRKYATLPGPTLTGYEFHEYTGTVTPITTRKVLASGATGSNLDSSGAYSTVDPINSIVSLITTRKSVDTSAIARSWTTGRHVTLPHVCTVLPTQLPFNDSNGNPVFVGVYYQLKNYSGNYVITVQESWSLTPVSGIAPTQMIEEGASWDTPFGPGSLPECLHASFTISGTTGSSGATPVGASLTGRTYGAISWSWTFPATSPASLSGTIVIADEQTPYAGGFLRHKESISI